MGSEPGMLLAWPRVWPGVLFCRAAHALCATCAGRVEVCGAFINTLEYYASVYSLSTALTRARSEYRGLPRTFSQGDAPG